MASFVEVSITIHNAYNDNSDLGWHQ